MHVQNAYEHTCEAYFLARNTDECTYVRKGLTFTRESAVPGRRKLAAQTHALTCAQNMDMTHATR